MRYAFSGIFALTLLLLISAQVFAQSLYFPPLTGSTWETTDPAELGYCQTKIDSLYEFLEAGSTKAFILLKDGKIVLERYFGDHTVDSPWQWASAGKTITAMMTGIAQEEGFLSIEDPTSQYLGSGWTSCTPEQEEAITIRHQLTMTSGLDDGVIDPYCTDPECLLYLAEPGTRWAYHNGPYTLLDEVIESATGTTLNQYINQKLKIPTGMTGVFLPVDYNNVFFSNARSMARFGLLMLNEGNWNGTPVLTDMEYFHAMITPSQDINNSYGYLWWLNGQASYMVPGAQFVIPGYLNPSAPPDVITAMGKDGQFLNVNASENIVWIRMGEAPDNIPVPFLLNDEIWQYINELVCGTSGIRTPDAPEASMRVYPNPVQNELRLQADAIVNEIICTNAQGQVVYTSHPASSNFRVSFDDLPAGVYYLRATFENGGEWTGKVVRE